MHGNGNGHRIWHRFGHLLDRYVKLVFLQRTMAGNGI